MSQFERSAQEIREGKEVEPCPHLNQLSPGV